MIATWIGYGALCCCTWLGAAAVVVERVCCCVGGRSVRWVITGSESGAVDAYSGAGILAGG